MARIGAWLAVAALGGTLPSLDAQTRSRAAEQVAPRRPGYVVPRTPWGDPDLEGIWPSTNMVRVPLERPLQYGQRVLMSDEEQQVLEQRENEQIARTDRNGAGGALGAPGNWLEWGQSQRQTSLLIDPPDGRMPALTMDGQARQAQLPRGTAGFSVLRGPEDFTPVERCISRGVVGSTLPVLYGSGLDITQSPGYVALRYEMIHDVRIIPLSRQPHLAPALTKYMGDARGRWDGDTLVVETANLSPKIGLGPNGNGAPPSPSAKLTERFTRVGPDTIRYEVTVNDLRTFQAPWTVAFPLTRMPDYLMAEYGCHEGNRGLQFSLAGARADEAKGMGK